MGDRCGDPIRFHGQLPFVRVTPMKKPRATAAGWPHGLPCDSHAFPSTVRLSQGPHGRSPDLFRRLPTPVAADLLQREVLSVPLWSRARPRALLRAPASGRGRRPFSAGHTPRPQGMGRSCPTSRKQPVRNRIPATGPFTTGSGDRPVPAAALASGHGADRTQASHVAQRASADLGEPGRRLVAVGINTLGPGLQSVACWRR